ncbi:hypothetical protein H8E77_15300 [bacterium]|nr:hypothetical protein [bacterium]
MQELNLELDDGLVEALHSLGKLNEIVPFALKRYSIDEVLKRIEELKKEITEWEIKYNMSYNQFQAKIVDDEQFLDNLNQQHPMWEADLMYWESQQRELNQWRLLDAKSNNL